MGVGEVSTLYPFSLPHVRRALDHYCLLDIYSCLVYSAAQKETGGHLHQREGAF